jgi:hypothetical protein
VGYYAICFPNPIGTSGGNIISSAINTGGLNPKTSLLPQSCLGISVTLVVPLTTPANLVSTAPAARIPTAASVNSFPFYFY